MTSTTLLLLFLALFAANIILTLLLEFLNRQSLSANPTPPKELNLHTDSAEYQKSQRYTKEKSTFSIVSLAINTTITLAILLSGILPFTDSAIPALLGIEKLGLTHSVLFLVLLSAIHSIASLPLSLYSTFKIEAAYGFNKQTLRDFFVDELKGLAVSIAIGVPFLYGVFWFFEATGSYWWIWLFVFIALFQIVMMLIYPIIIAPLFNKFEPLPEGELKEQLTALADKAEFSTQGIFVMDGSRKSSHSNAYFTGFGKLRRIVLYDTLIQQLTTDQLTAVLAHEIGHYKMKHIYKMITIALFSLFLGLYVLSYAINWDTMYHTFLVEKSHHMGLFLFITLSSTFLFFFTPLFNSISRKHEYEADAYAAALTGSAPSMQQALTQLSSKNLSNLTPHRLYSSFYYSHPTTIERIRALDSLNRFHEK